MVEARKLTGTAGQTLYLESLQLVLRQQLAWLVESKGYTEELEAVVKDLWDVRLRGAPVDQETGASDGGEREMSVFSSQSEADSSQDESGAQGLGMASHRWGVKTRRWPNPKPLDTLALCYLGGHLLRIPLRIGQIERWAAAGHMPFMQAVRALLWWGFCAYAGVFKTAY
jgi:hypothetical protein